MKFDFSKSNESDFRNKLQSDLDILMKNVLYITHQIDALKKVVVHIDANTGLQKQVDEYFDRDETSPQTEPEEQNGNHTN